MLVSLFVGGRETFTVRWPGMAHGGRLAEPQMRAIFKRSDDKMYNLASCLAYLSESILINQRKAKFITLNFRKRRILDISFVT